MDQTPFQIFARGVKSGQTLTVDVQPTDSLSEVKYKILHKATIQFDQHYAMRVKWQGKQLEDNASVRDCAIEKGVTLDVRVRGLGR